MSTQFTIVFDKKVNTSKIIPKEQSQFQNLWHQIEKEQLKIERLKIKQKEMYVYFKDHALQAEYAYIESLHAQAEKLMSFLLKKSIKHEQKEALIYWIHDLFDSIYERPIPHPNINVTDLNNKLEHILKLDFINTLSKQSADNNMLKKMRDELYELFDYSASDEELVKLINDPYYFDKIMQKLMDQKDNAFDDKFDNSHEFDQSTTEFFEALFKQMDQSDHFDDFNPDIDDEQIKENSELSHLFNKSELKKIYKKLANLFHPDKEIDPELKERKHLQMQILAKAKKENDAYTILSLYLSHANEELTLSPGSIAQLTILLEQKLRHLKAEYTEISKYPSQESSIWQKFKAKNKANTERKMKAYLDSLTQVTNQAQQITNSIKTIKILMLHIEQRNMSTQYASRFY